MTSPGYDPFAPTDEEQERWGGAYDTGQLPNSQSNADQFRGQQGGSRYTTEDLDDADWGDGLKADFTMLQEFGGFLKGIRTQQRNYAEGPRLYFIFEMVSVSPIKVEKDYNFDADEFEFRISKSADKEASPNSGFGLFIESCAKVMGIPPDPNQIKMALDQQQFATFFQFAKKFNAQVGRFTVREQWLMVDKHDNFREPHEMKSYFEELNRPKSSNGADGAPFAGNRQSPQLSIEPPDWNSDDSKKIIANVLGSFSDGEEVRVTELRARFAKADGTGNASWNSVIHRRPDEEGSLLHYLSSIGRAVVMGSGRSATVQIMFPNEPPGNPSPFGHMTDEEMQDVS